MRNVLKISPDDSVAVALTPLKAGDAIEVDGKTITLLDDIPAGHKVALNAMHKGEHVIKYGFPIGEAKTDIPQGSHVHVHNLRTLLSGELEYQYHPHGKPLAARPAATFAGYPRRDGRVGVRNELWILPTVGCVNDVARALERRAQALVGGGVEGVYAFPHPYGCSQMGEDQEHTRAILCGLIRHPNAGAVLVLGLGCENSSIAVLQERLGRWDSQRVAFLECQAVEDELAEGERLLRELADRAVTAALSASCGVLR